MLLDGRRTSAVKFLGVEKIQHAHDDRLKVSILEALRRIKLRNWKKNFLH